MVCLVAVLAVGEAQAAPLPVEIKTPNPEVNVDDDGARTVKIGFENKTDGPVTVTAIPARVRNDCDFRYTTVLRAGKPGSLEVGLENCKKSSPVKVEVEGSPAASLSVLPKEPKEKPEPEWNRLSQGFGWGGAISLAVVILSYVVWALSSPNGRHPFRNLDHIDSTWSLKENWATDIAAVSAFFTGVFGTAGVVKAFAGDEGVAMLAVTTVAAAVALSLIGLTPIVLQVTKGIPKPSFTILGVLLGAILILTSALGQLWVVYNTGKLFEMGGVENHLKWPFLVGAVLLLAYVGRSLWEILQRGTTPPAAPVVSDPTGEAARVIARPLWHGADLNAEKEFLRGTEKDRLLKEALEAATAVEVAKEKLETLEKKLEGETSESKKEALECAIANAKDRLKDAKEDATLAAERSAASGEPDALDEVQVPAPDVRELIASAEESSPPPYQSTSAMI